MRIIQTGSGVNISIQQGETVQLPITLTGDYSLYTFKVGIGKPQIFGGSGTPTFSAPSYSAGTGLTSTTLTIPSATTAAFATSPNYPWDVWLVSPAGVETPILSGLWAVTLTASTVP